MALFSDRIDDATLNGFDRRRFEGGSRDLSFVLACSPDDECYAGVTSRHSKCYETFCCSIRRGGEAEAARGDTGNDPRVRRGEDTIECWRIRGRDAVRLFLYRDHPRSLSYDDNGDLTRHSVPVDLYRVSSQPHISR